MKYDNIVKGIFLERPNRFIAKVLINGKEETVHVKNTGRCKELLIKGREIYLKHESNPNRKTAYSLISVNKDGLLVNMDSQVPNLVVFEALSNNLITGISGKEIKREKTFGSSRFDIYFENFDKEAFMEVKGVTLEENGYARFPDAPTSRGVKHINELIKAKAEGYDAFIFFLLQMKGMKEFTPNYTTDEAFSYALENADKKGVKILCYDCIVDPDSITINKEVKISLGK